MYEKKCENQAKEEPLSFFWDKLSTQKREKIKKLIKFWFVRND